MIFFFFGFFGGIIRGTVGLIKYTQSYKDVEIRPVYFIGSVLFSGLVGLLSAWVVQDMGIAFLEMDEFPVSMALVVGYAGGDFIENIYKIIIKSPTIFKVK